MTTPNEKAFWQAIVEADFAMPEGYTTADLTPHLLDFLASTEIDVRDPFGYTIFAVWIVRNKYYTPDELRALRDQLLVNLNHKLGEVETDSVFLRSFSALVLSLIVYRDNAEPFFAESEVADLVDAALHYLRGEHDLRGFVPGKGWAHSCAHTADLLKFLARNTRSTVEQHNRILTGIADKLRAPSPYVYIHNEDERLTLVLVDVLKRKLVNAEFWAAWLEGFTEWRKALPQNEEYDPVAGALFQNIRNFLRSFYFALLRNPEFTDDALKDKARETAMGFFSL